MKIYDTTYPEVMPVNDTGISITHKQYKLPETELILLIFMSEGSDQRLFTTMRYFTEHKYKYYKSKEGELFKVIVEDEYYEKT